MRRGIGAGFGHARIVAHSPPASDHNQGRLSSCVVRRRESWPAPSRKHAGPYPNAQGKGQDRYRLGKRSEQEEQRKRLNVLDDDPRRSGDGIAGRYDPGGAHVPAGNILTEKCWKKARPSDGDNQRKKEREQASPNGVAPHDQTADGSGHRC